MTTVPRLFGTGNRTARSESGSLVKWLLRKDLIGFSRKKGGKQASGFLLMEGINRKQHILFSYASLPRPIIMRSSSILVLFTVSKILLICDIETISLILFTENKTTKYFK